MRISQLRCQAYFWRTRLYFQGQMLSMYCAEIIGQELFVMHTINEDSLVEFVFSHYHQSLQSSARAMRFLQNIGFGDSHLVFDLYLGFSDRTLGSQLPPDTLPTGAAVRGCLRRLGLLRASGHEQLRGCVTFPLRDSRGKVTGAYAFKLNDYEKGCRLVPVSWVRESRS